MQKKKKTTPKPLIKTLQQRHIKRKKNLQPSLNILSPTCNLRPSFCGSRSIPSSRLSLLHRVRQREASMPPALPLCSCPTHHVPPRSASRFTNLLIPVLLAHSPGWHHRLRRCQRCSIKPGRVSVCRVPLLRWDCYERCEWEDVCSK